jgi:hypothetical protein
MGKQGGLLGMAHPGVPWRARGPLSQRGPGNGCSNPCFDHRQSIGVVPCDVARFDHAWHGEPSRVHYRCPPFVRRWDSPPSFRRAARLYPQPSLGRADRNVGAPRSSRLWSHPPWKHRSSRRRVVTHPSCHQRRLLRGFSGCSPIGVGWTASSYFKVPSRAQFHPRRTIG